MGTEEENPASERKDACDRIGEKDLMAGVNPLYPVRRQLPPEDFEEYDLEHYL